VEVVNWSIEAGRRVMCRTRLEAIQRLGILLETYDLDRGFRTRGMELFRVCGLLHGRQGA
jgi:hypothetical protein